MQKKILKQKHFKKQSQDTLNDNLNNNYNNDCTNC